MTHDSSDLLDRIDSRWLRRFRRGVRSWYVENGRHLPWRNEGDAYRVWLSEVMLQQTTVAAVKPYYERFTAELPTVQTLADADEADVLRLWEGLGYYSRARNLHKAARAVCEQHDGQLPNDVKSLEGLPGIGRYTAGAIASFAFGLKAPIVEANTVRLYARLLGLETDPRATRGQRTLWNFAERILPDREPGEFNQAVMDLGSIVCTPQEPLCHECPVKSCCQAFADGRQATIPLAKTRPQPTDVTDAVVVLRHKDRVFLRRRGPDERWRGLWDFPRLTLDAAPECGWIPREEAEQLPAGPAQWSEFVRSWLERRDWEAPVRIDQAGELRHTVTRYRIRLLIFEGECTADSFVTDQENMGWFDAETINDQPLSTTGRKIAELVFRRVGSVNNLVVE